MGQHNLKQALAACVAAVAVMASACGSGDSAESIDAIPAGPSTQSAGSAGGATTTAVSSTMATAFPTAPQMTGTFPTAPDMTLLFPAQVRPDPGTGAPACEGSIRLTGSHFETARWEVLPEAEAVIEKALATLQGYTDDWKVIIYGHTDARPFNGLPGGNEELSQLRAQAVADKLIALGLDANRIDDIVGVGASELLNSEDTPDAHAENRRVEIVRYCAAEE